MQGARVGLLFGGTSWVEQPVDLSVLTINTQLYAVKGLYHTHILTNIAGNISVWVSFEVYDDVYKTYLDAVLWPC